MDSWTYGNGLTQQLEHDLDGRITAVRVQNKKQDPIWQQAYQYDRLDNITGIERSEGQETYQQQFGYDMLQRLIKDQGPYGQQRFEYDAVGNRLSQHYAQNNTAATKDDSDENLTRYHYAPASNRLLGTTEKDIVLDPAGNTLQESNDLQHSYAYNAQNRISEYSKNGQVKARYHYNALGQRIHKAIVGADGSKQHTLFHYDQQGQLLGETQLNVTDTNDQQHTQNIVWLQMRPIVAIDTNENETPRLAWLHSDHLLTARAATDDNQNIIWRWRSDAFGVGNAESLAQAGQSELTLNLRFPGQYHDEESGLYYNYFRTYDPSKGRYTQSDPIGLAGGIDSFSYASGNPLTFIDLFGLCDKGISDGDWTDNWFSSGNHKYDYIGKPICYASETCTFDSVMAALNKKGLHPNQTTPFIPGKEYVADVNLPGPFGSDSITSTAVFDGKGKQIGIRNQTLEDHLLHPGVVERTVINQNGAFHIVTQGGGYGVLGGPNIWLTDGVWDPVDPTVRAEVLQTGK